MYCAVRFWIILSTLLVSSGWVLSAAHELNRAGYLAVFLAAALAAGWQWRKANAPRGEAFIRALRKLRKRFKRLAPALFLVLALFSLAGGLAYYPSNGDSNSYRIPRVFHWLGQQQWHWIHSLDDRMNITGCGFEWMAAPLMLFTRSNQDVFLVNLAAFLLLPGLIFSVFTRLRVPRRVAWWWMWLLSAGWCYAMQASADVNDSFPVIYALASVDLALRGIAKKNLGDLWLSLLAAALLTGTKQTCLPLVLLWCVAVWPGVPLLLRRPLATAAVALVGLLVSAVPLAWINLRHTGVWTGVSPDLTPISPLYGTQAGSPFWSIVGNLFCLPIENLKPPVFPWSSQWGDLMGRFMQTPLGAHFTSFEAFGSLGPGVSETNAGIGLGLCIFTPLSILAGIWLRRATPAKPAGAPGLQLRLLYWTPFLCVLIFMAKVTTYQNSRQLAAYYVFLYPVLLSARGQLPLVRRRWWRGLGMATMVMAAFLLVVARGRPLFPARSMITKLEARHPDSRGLSKALDSFFWTTTVEATHDFILRTVPPGEPVIGYATDWSTAEPSMWLPFGMRRVERVLPGDTNDDLRARKIHYVYVDFTGLNMPEQPPQTIEQWMSRRHGQLVDELSLTNYPFAYRLKVGTNDLTVACKIFLVRLDAGPAPQ